MTREEAYYILRVSRDEIQSKGHTEFDMLDLPCLDMAIAALREQPRWISVEERLPEESGRYIVLRKSGDCLDCCYEKERDSWGVLIDMGEAGALWVAYNGVTHWMQLPEPPEVEV